MTQATSVGRGALGPAIWACALYYLATILACLGLVLFIGGDDFSYDVTLARMLAGATLSSVALWLIWQRAAATRRFAVAAGAVMLALTALDVWVGEGLHGASDVLDSPPALATDAVFCACTVAVMAYLGASRASRAALTRPLSALSEPVADPGELGPYYFERPLSWHWWRNLGIYYMASSLIGHWGEIGFCWLIVLGVFQGSYDFSHAQLWSWWLDPYPAEGVAAVLCAALLYPLTQWIRKRFDGRILPTLLVSFLVTMAACASVDFLTGILFNYDYQFWDYRDLPFNFMGQIVLQNTLVYSVIATFVVWVLYPWVAGLLAKGNQNAITIFFFALLGAYVVLCALYFVVVTPQGIVLG